MRSDITLTNHMAASVSAGLLLAWGKPSAFGKVPWAGEGKSVEKTKEPARISAKVAECSIDVRV